MASHEESIPDLIRGTIRDGIGLVRDEIFLVRTELREEIARIKSGLITVAAAVSWLCSRSSCCSTRPRGERFTRSTGQRGRASAL